MRPLRTACLALVLSFAAIPVSHASGGLWCSAEDGNLRLTIESGMSHGLGGAFFNMKASAELLDSRVAADFRNLVLDDKLVHSWVDADETRLLFYTERSDGDFGSMELTIETKGDRDEGDIPGTYELAYFEASRQQGDDDGFIRFSGPITCGGE